MKDTHDNTEKMVMVLFEEQVKKTPENIALVSDQETLNYRSLNAKANQLAHYLIKQGVGPETVVALHLGRSVQAIVVILAVLKAGGAYLPLDLNDPLARLQFILKDSRCDFLITPSHNELSKVISKKNRPYLIVLDEIAETLTKQPKNNLSSLINLNSLAYVIYTSGSTGQPKGVEIEHKGVSNLIKAQIAALDVTTESRILQFAALYFDGSIHEIWMSLLSGASLYIPTETCRRDPVALSHYISAQQISLAVLTPASLINMPIPRRSFLRTLVVAGDTCPKKIMDLWYQHCCVINLYGPTETTIWATMFVYDGQAHRCIGQPFANITCYVLNEQFDEVAEGEVGELYIGGMGVARGYRNKEELTKQRFIFWKSDKNQTPIRLYKTGDWVRRLPENNLDFIGRVDFQIKFHSVRIDPAEIEVPLNDHPIVEHSVVAHKKQGDQEYLIAYIVSKEKVKNKTIASNQLREHLQTFLPASRLPNIFMFLDAFPLSATGKVDRNALPPPDFNDLPENERVLTEEEYILSALWAEVLNISSKSISSNSNFFTLGGDSLLATHLALKLSSQWGMVITGADIFARPILKDQVLMRDSLISRNNELTIVPQKRPDILPLSFGQRRLWLAYQVLRNQRPQAYNVNLQLKFEGKLDKEALQNALQALINRHETLRTYFPKVGMQSIGEFKIALEQQSTDKALLNDLIHSICEHDFGDLTVLPLMRTVLIEIGKNYHVLCLVFHHIIIDGIALLVFVRELNAFYNAHLENTQIKLPCLPFQYADFAVWQQQALEAGKYEVAFDYWKQQLSEISGLFDLPFDKPRPEYPTYEGGTHIFYFPKKISLALKQLAKQQGVTLFTLLLSSIATLLYRYNQQEDFVIGVAYGKRLQPDLNQLIAFFVNMLPIRIRAENQLSFLTLLAQVQDSLTEAYTHTAPLEEIIEQLGLPHRAGRHPLFQVTVTMHDSAELNLDFTGLTTSLLSPSLITASDLDSARFDLGFEMELLNDDRLIVKIEYAKDLFFLETIERIAKQWLALCECLIKTPHESLETTSLLNDKEKQQQLTEWNRIVIHPCPEATLISIFEEQVQKHSISIAVVDSDQQLTYHELNEQANRLTYYLLKINGTIKKDSFIAIMMDRSVEFIVSALAVLKTGAAYLPLDPELPTQRLQFMLTDAKVTQLITLSEFKKNIADIEINSICLDDKAIKSELVTQTTTNPNIPVNPSDLAYVIYTSGSTGKPKGVMIEHQSVSNLVKNPNYVKIGAKDTIAHVSTTVFDASIFEIWGALLNGARLVIYKKSIVLNPPEFKSALTRDGITILVLTTALFYRFILQNNEFFSMIKWLFFAGEKLVDTKILNPLLRNPAIAPNHLINIYGPTENTVFSLYYPLDLDQSAPRELPIGLPINGTQTYVLNSCLQPVAENVLGELYLGGLGLARGYLNQKELTQQRFIPNPFTNDGSLLYRTGDLVRYQANGDLIFIKRTDQQVKLAGHRIELEEIEKALLAQAKIVKEALVLKQVVDEHPMLVAYIVPKNQTLNSQKLKLQLREHLCELLPPYMIPSAFMLMDTLPLNLSGKLDQRQLPAVSFELDHEYVPPTTATEKKLVQLWQSVLSSQQKIGIRENFFTLGGSSLLAMSLTSLIHQEFGSISYSDLFMQPTIQSQAQLIETPEQQRITPRHSIEYFKKEAELDKDISLSCSWKKSDYTLKPKTILLTGATGFLGVFLLDELLQTGDAIIYCLIRAKNHEHAEARFRETVQKYRLTILQHNLERIRWVLGDIGKQNLGLSKKDYEDLASRIEIIYHSASAVNFLKPYSALKKINVDGVKNILRFVIAKKTKPLHFVSSIAVFSFSHYFKKTTALKEEEVIWDDAYAQALPHDLGYVQTKAVAEKLVWQANARGIPVTIHRPGFILCHSQTGAGNKEQLWAMLIKDCVAIKSYPHFIDLKEEFVTVDYTSQAIVHIAQQPNCLGKIFHITPKPQNNITTDEWFELVRQIQSSLKSKSLAEWRSRLRNYINSGNSSALRLLMPLFSDAVAGSLTLFEAYQNSPEYSMTNTQTALKQSNIVDSIIDIDILKRYLAYLIDDANLFFNSVFDNTTQYAETIKLTSKRKVS